MKYAVIDTNVLVSALLARHENAPSVQISKLLFSGKIVPLFSQEILSEYHQVLRRKKFSFSETAINTMLGAVEQHGILVAPTPTNETLHDIKDLPFYEVALQKQDVDAYLVTGNAKHFPAKPFIVTPKQMLDLICCDELREKR